MSLKSTFEDVYEATLKLLSSDSDGSLENLLSDIIALEREKESKKDSPMGSSWEWYEVHSDPRTLNSLVAKKILDITFKSNKSCFYAVADLGAVEKALEDYRMMVRPKEEEVLEIPDDLFSIVVGHEDKKDIILRSLKSDKPLHCLLHGSIASAKTLFIEELSRLPNSKFIIGSSLTKAGLSEILFTEKPRYLLIDELDKIDDADNLSILLSLMERGLIVETKYHRHRSLKLKTWVFSSSNEIYKLPPELLSRFLLLRFRDYTPDEYTDVVLKILKEREGIPEDIALYIADKALRVLGSKDVRDSIKIARLLREKSKNEVDKLVELIKKQR